MQHVAELPSNLSTAEGGNVIIYYVMRWKMTKNDKEVGRDIRKRQTIRVRRKGEEQANKKVREDDRSE